VRDFRQGLPACRGADSVFSAAMRSLVLCSFLAVAACAQADVQAFLTSPDIHGSKVVFTAEGDLWLSNLQTGESQRLTSDPGVETRAHFSPDGTQIAYSANYDGGEEVYVMPVTGGMPKRLTYDPTGAEVLGWTPDGSRILFRSKSKLVSSYVAAFSEDEVFTVSATGGDPVKVAVPKANFAEYSPDGQTLAFVPTSNEWMNWFRYEAGEADQIWLANLKSGGFEKLTDSKGIDTQPVWVGKEIYFISERSGIRNLFKLDPASRRVSQITFSTTAPVRNLSSDGTQVIYEIGPKLGDYNPAKGSPQVLDIHLNSDRIHARPFQFPVAGLSQADISPTGKRLVVVARGHLLTIPVEDGVNHEVAGGGVQRIQNAAWSPDGKKVAYTSDLSGEEELYVSDPVEGSAPRQVTNGLGGELYNPVWSPDCKYIVIGDRNCRIRLVDVTTGAIKAIAQTTVGMEYDSANNDYVFSPDSKWVAYQQLEGAQVPRVYLFEIATGKVMAVTNPTIASYSPAFSQDGKWLYVLQQREIDPAADPISGLLFADNTIRVTGIALAADAKSPFLDKNAEESDSDKAETPADGKKMKLDFDGLTSRLIDMRVPAGRYGKVVAQGDRLLLLNSTAPPIINGPPANDLVAFDIKAKSLTALKSGVTGASLSADGKKLLVASAGTLQVVDAGTGEISPTQGVVHPSGSVSIKPEDEWRQIFEESWRVARDFFYDPHMHGADWKQIRAKYEAELPLIGGRDDLTRVQADLISELNSGHCYVGAPPTFTRRSSQVGLLGADIDWDAAGAYKLTHIYRGDQWDLITQSPLSAQGINVKDGTYLLKIDGEALKKDDNPYSHLLGKVGTKISVTVNSKPALEGATTYTVTPIASESDLRHTEWIQSRRDYVAKATGGKVAYVYISDMEDHGTRDFSHDYYPNVEKAGIIVDVRGNGGGFTADQFFAQLACRQTGFFSTRNGNYMRIQNWAPLGHLAAVTDEWAFSDGEWFSEFWKRLGLGPLVGHRTGGGCVGSGGGYALVDGGVIFIPNYGAFVPGAWVIEGRGAVPDYEVDNDPASLMAGKDPQLDKTIALLLDEIAKHPVSLPEHPQFPIKTHGSREGYGG
jgi:tricorn protease